MEEVSIARELASKQAQLLLTGESSKGWCNYILNNFVPFRRGFRPAQAWQDQVHGSRGTVVWADSAGGDVGEVGAGGRPGRAQCCQAEEHQIEASL